MNEESATAVQQKLCLQKNVKTGKGHSTVTNLIQLVQWFEETGSLEDCVKFGPDITMPDIFGMCCNRNLNIKVRIRCRDLQCMLKVYLKHRECRLCPSNLSELKDEVSLELTCIQQDILQFAVPGFVPRLQCVLPCDGGGHVELMML
ncbi:hypothetical protein TNCV_1563551 [Trichonephila clavipes]|nr:hypothetical protein TNCV_1563551 [Trichonephila clavipes]